MKKKFNTEYNFKNLFADYKRINVNAEHRDWSKLFMPVHGTTIERLEMIIKDGYINSHKELSSTRPNIVKQRLENATDELDISLGLDQYVFMNVGRVHPGDIQEVYICFPNSEISKEHNLVALQEITHFGAIVSPESARIHESMYPNSSVKRTNKRATENFFKTVIKGETFPKLYASFLQKHFPNLLDYSTNLLFPNEKPVMKIIEDTPCLVNAWEGPQLKIPRRQSIESACCIFIPSTEESTIKHVKNLGFLPNRVYSMGEGLVDYDTHFKEQGLESTKYRFINFALRDLAIKHGDKSEKYESKQISYND